MTETAAETAITARWAHDDARARARIAGSGLMVEMAGFARLTGLREAWKALASVAAEPNVFLDPDFAIPAVEALGLAARLEALLVWRGDSLVGMFAFTRRRRWGPAPAVGEALVHPYAPVSAPLVAADAVEGTVEAFLDWLSADAHAPAAWLFNLMPGDGPVAEALDAALTRRGISAHILATHARPVFEATSAGPGWLADALPKKTRKEFARLERRLSDLGAVTRTTAVDVDGVGVAVGEFLALEEAGWKGRLGTAAARSAAIAAMFRAATTALARDGRCRVDTLRLDGRALAATISLGAGDRRWLWKIAYDESFAPLSPGVRLVASLTAEAADRQDGLWDSCALPGIGMIERLWRARRPYRDLLIVTAGSALAGAAPHLERARRHAERAAKTLRDRLRG